MAEEATRALALLAAAWVSSAIAIVLFARVAPRMGLIDVPGGRKAHARAVPLVGGLAVFASLLVAAWAGGIAHAAAWFLVALAIVITVGLWDDVTDLPARLKLAIQVIASGIMIWGAGVELHSVGDLLGWRAIGLWIFGVPLTVFSIVGVVNAVNMMDGLDGLGGSIALVAFAWYAAIAGVSGLDAQFQVAVILCGAIAGFLLFNLRFPWQSHARVFLGDAGSLMIGFALGWFAIDLTQGPGRTLPPIAALWVLLVPLADCVSLMARRLARRRSPFVADRQHIHHYLLARGLTPNQVVAVLAAASGLFGAVGYFGWRLDVPEPALFWPFFAGFFAYHAWIQRAWRRLEAATAPSAPLLSLDEDEVRVPG
ncbi:MAG TPA: MraY family glycosyltransferase [Usitatibacter sp.]|jgi:UDP-GlcNAc:undecaprenyl-phosphate GlcNAc-1-phosphate transferase|nr:MraY family glycosyltransferase [Usitatibacter sp.]